MAEQKSVEQLEKENFLRKQLGEEEITNTKTDIELAAEKVIADKLQAENDAKLKLEEENRIKAENEQKEDELKKAAEEGEIKLTKTAVTPIAKKEDGFNEEDDIDDAKLLKALSKKVGKEITSLEEYLTPKKAEPTAEEIEKLKEQRESDKIAFGLSKGLVTKKDYEGYIADAKDPVGLVFKQYLEDAIKEDNTLTEKEVREEFEAKYGLDREQDTREYKRGIKEIGVLATSIINNTYSNVLNLENEYAKFENQQKSNNEYKQTVLSKAPQYKKDVEDTVNEIKSIRVKFSEDEAYDVTIDATILEDYKVEMLDEKYAENKIAKGYTKEEITNNVINAIKVEYFDEIVKKVSNQRLLKKEKGLKGVLPTKDFTARKELTSEQKDKIEFFKKQTGLTEVENN